MPLAGDLEGFSEADAKSLGDAVSAEIKARPGSSVIPSPKEDLIDLMFDAECLEPDSECLAKIGAARQADAVLFYEGSSKNGATSVRFRLVDVKSKTDKERAVNQATVAATLQGWSKSSKALLGPKPPPKPKMVVLRVRSEPPAATVFVDGKEIGLTPLEIRREAGSVKLRVTKDGYRELNRTVELKDKPLGVDLRLTALPKTAAAVAATATPAAAGEAPVPPSEEQDEFYETWWFWTVVGVGAAGVGLGIAAAAGAFDSDTTSTGGVTFRFGQQADQDAAIQSQFR